MWHRLALTALCISGAIAPEDSFAQTQLPVSRPGDEPLEEALWYQSDRAPVLPPLEKTLGVEPEELSSALQVFVEEYRFVGNTVFSDAELSSLVQQYSHRNVSALELETLRQYISAYYVGQGYVNSGAVFPDQDLADRIVTVQIVEGNLASIQTSGVDRLPAAYVEKQIAANQQPLNIEELEKELQQLQRDPRIQSLHAELVPGPRPGVGALLLDVTEANPYRFEVGVDNSRAPSVGEYQAVGRLTNYNLFGFADMLNAELGLTEGLNDASVTYRVPLGRYSTSLDFGYRYTDAEVVEEPFDDLDIETRSDTWRIGTFHNIRDELRSTVNLGFRLERRKTRTDLLGDPFSFSPGAEDGVYRVTALRAEQNFFWRTPERAIGVRSTLSFGVDAFDATMHAGKVEDGRFVSWLGQLSWAQRFLNSGIELAFRSDLQLSNDALLPVEQIAIGGDYSVRGYRRNQLIRDQGIVASAEVRFPLMRSFEGRPTLQFAVFADYGRGWNKNREFTADDEIAGAGVGLRWNVRERWVGHIYWADQLIEAAEPQDESLQDQGWHFRVAYQR